MNMFFGGFVIGRKIDGSAAARRVSLYVKKRQAQIGTRYQTAGTSAEIIFTGIKPNDRKNNGQ